MRALQWQDPPSGRDGAGAVGYSGKVVAARIAQRPIDGQWLWQVVGANVRDISRASGEAVLLAKAQAQAERSWCKWLHAAGLDPPASS